MTDVSQPQDPAPVADPAADPVAVEPPDAPETPAVEGAPAPAPEPEAPAAPVEPNALRQVAAIDGTIEQGNRVTIAAAITPGQPVRDLLQKIQTHWDAAVPVLSDIRAAVDQLQALLDRLKVGN